MKPNQKKAGKPVEVCVCVCVCVCVFWPHRKACVIFVPRPGDEPGPQQWKHWIRTTGLPGNSLKKLFEWFLCTGVLNLLLPTLFKHEQKIINSLESAKEKEISSTPWPGTPANTTPVKPYIVKALLFQDFRTNNGWGESGIKQGTI